MFFERISIISMQEQFLSRLKKALAKPLPGKNAQHLMAPGVRRFDYVVPENARVASVLVLFEKRKEGLSLVLIERAAKNPEDIHSGQISFPGGKMESGDTSLTYTALRETEEEIGIEKSKVSVIGALSQLYIPVSNFLVHPFVGYVDGTQNYIKQSSEVAEILPIPFEYFFKAVNKREKDIKVSNNIILKNVPYYDIHERVIWGATAMIISELEDVSSRVITV